MSKLISQFLTITGLAPALVLTQLQPTTQKSFTNQQLNAQSIMALNWVQKSGEYRALAYQTFNLAKLAFDTAKSQQITNPTVIVDIDETLLDNSPYQAGLLDNEDGFQAATWYEWIKSEKAPAIPGSVDFVNYVNNHGGKVFFISNRYQKSNRNSSINDLEIATINNLKSVGFTGVNEQTVLLKGEFTKIINGKKNSSRKLRIQAIKNGSVDGSKHTIIALIGDSLNDFDEKAGRSNQKRRNYVDKYRSSYGILQVLPNGKIKPAYIAIPNPMYGDWEIGIYNPEKFNKKVPFLMTPGERSQQRQESLTRWLSNSHSVDKTP